MHGVDSRLAMGALGGAPPQHVQELVENHHLREEWNRSGNVKQKKSKIERHKHRQAHRHEQTDIHRQTGRHTHRQTQREKGRKTCMWLRGLGKEVILFLQLTRMEELSWSSSIEHSSSCRPGWGWISLPPTDTNLSLEEVPCYEDSGGEV